MLRSKVQELLKKSKQDFINGVTTNGEQKAVDFFISELTDSYREDRMLIRPSQVFGVLSLLKQKVPDIKHHITLDYPPSNVCGLFDEGQVYLELKWEGPFPGTGPNPTCFVYKK